MRLGTIPSQQESLKQSQQTATANRAMYRQLQSSKSVLIVVELIHSQKCVGPARNRDEFFSFIRRLRLLRDVTVDALPDPTHRRAQQGESDDHFGDFIDTGCMSSRTSTFLCYLWCFHCLDEK